MNPATTKPRLGPPGCILHCCGVVVWSGQQQQHASPCITLSSFLQIPNGSRARVWDAIFAGCRVYFIPIHYGAAAPSKQRVWLTSLLYASALELETNLRKEWSFTIMEKCLDSASVLNVKVLVIGAFNQDKILGAFFELRFQLYSAPLVFKVWLWLVSIITGALAIKYWYSSYYINFSWRKQSY